MNVNHQNIDQVLFEYVEGNLSDIQEKELFTFIEQNPIYINDLQAWNQTIVKQDKTTNLGFVKSKIIRKKIKWSYFYFSALVLAILGISTNYLLLNEQKDAANIVDEISIEKPILVTKLNKLKVENKIEIQKNKKQIKTGKDNKIDYKKIERQLTTKIVENVQEEKPTEIDIEYLAPRKISLLESEIEIRQIQSLSVQGEKRTYSVAKKKYSYTNKKGPGVIPLNVSGF